MTEIERIKQENWLPEDFWKAETICDYYVSEDMKKVWAILLDLYKEFSRICEKHGLQYWANGGTALGAVRHNGFIPWDDDMDFHMMRDDYDKLVSLANEFKEPYFLQHPTTDKECGFSFLKIRNSNTTAIGGKFSYANFNHGIYIDVMPIDDVESEYDMEERSKKITELVMHNSAKMRKDYPNKDERDIEIIKKYYKPEFSTLEIMNEIDEIAKEKQGQNSKYVGQITLHIPGQYKLTQKLWRKEVFDGYKEFDFNGLKMRVPFLYEEYLERHFGDWKKFPPMEKRGCWHDFEYYPEIPYATYKKQKGMII